MGHGKLIQTKLGAVREDGKELLHIVFNLFSASSSGSSMAEYFTTMTVFSYFSFTQLSWFFSIDCF